MTHFESDTPKPKVTRFPFLLPVSVALRVCSTRYVSRILTNPHSKLMLLSVSIALGGVRENGRLLRERVRYG